MNIRDHQTDQEPPSAEVRAGEYVLGVLDADTRAQTRQRIRSEPAFARLVAQWEQRLNLLAQELPAADAPPRLWRGVRARLGWDADEPRSSGWNSLALWRGLTGVAAVAAVALFVVGRAPPAPVPPPPAPPVAQEEDVARPVTPLTRDDGQPGWLASVDKRAGKVLMVPIPSPADAQGRVGELWVIAKGEAPRSLGFVSNEKAHSVAVPAALLDKLTPGSTLAVTLEPAQGIPHAAPTGPIVAKGAIGAI
ncbi:anti-sigma factor [Lysobacter enzymogenes]|uniref:anti-sigma factor n=1 Tax=Lysobacter enzymogenes TaxID=69 RepID=UPI001A95BD3A|nr:anti-sigma factor [Lysobacter enzymogenes]QQP97168.1 anti-sigma factor [Lysobacter enzymogenes]